MITLDAVHVAIGLGVMLFLCVFYIAYKLGRRMAGSPNVAVKRPPPPNGWFRASDWAAALRDYFEGKSADWYNKGLMKMQAKALPPGPRQDLVRQHRRDDPVINPYQRPNCDQPAGAQAGVVNNNGVQVPAAQAAVGN